MFTQPASSMCCMDSPSGAEKLSRMSFPGLLQAGQANKQVEPTAGSPVFECSLRIVTSWVLAAVAHPQRSATDIQRILL